MNTQQARTRVAETFPHAFNREKFLEFIRNLLNKIDESKASQWNNTFVKDAFKPHVARFERLGTYTSPDDEKLDVLIVHLTNESKLERARTAIRNFVADHLKTRNEKDAALVAFVSPTEHWWRFSFVKMEYCAAESESGKVGIETRLTPARRFSYIVGEGESCHTAQSRFLKLLQDTENYPTLAQIEDAFSVEAVTKEFFNQYATLFDHIEQTLKKLSTKDKTIRDEFKEHQVSTVDFAKKLMGQIVFLYFLQKKGWLGVEKGKDWGTGPHDFLRRLADGKYGAYENFFNDVLEPLFYETLATDRGHEAWCKSLKCRIPFLNGGLFEPIGDYDWRKTDIILPNEFFTNNIRNDAGDIGTGILDVFDRHNFTVNEAAPLEKDVAIDPEMLGKVFENLIEENRRKGLGSFYTPREIVHYMCQQSLINYLDTSVNIPNNSIPREDIETFVQLGDQISHYEAVDTRYVGREMPKLVKEHAKLIDEKLADITICDPAVGSGAFPVGMMSEIVRARSALTPYFNDFQDRTPYHFKRHAIQNCLYGVDIDPGAVEIAKLRLWLSLVVDEEDVKQIKPLPNLSYKIVTGNSLLGVEKDLFNQQLFRRLEELKPRYFDEPDQNKKINYKQQIENTIHELTRGEATFDFEVYFSEVLRGKSFNIVIANPPYIGESGHKDLFRKTKKGPLGEFYLGKMDYFYFFLHLALNLVTACGSIAFITTNYYLTAAGARKLRFDFKNRALLLRIINFNELRIFESALGQHNLVTILQKGGGNKIIKTCVTNRTGLANPQALSSILRWNDGETCYYEVAQTELYDGPENYMRLNRERSPSGAQKPTINEVLDKVATQGETLGRIANINQGVVSGCDFVSSRNEDRLTATADSVHGDGIFVFDLDNPRDKRVISSFAEKEVRLLRKFFKNSDISRFGCSLSTSKRLLYIGRDLNDLRDYPNVLNHLKRFRSILAERREVQNGVIQYFQLQWPRTEEIFTGPKIVVPYRSEENAFAYNDTEWFCRSDCYVITQKNPAFALGYLLSILNSTLYFQWLFHRGKRKGKMLEMFQIPLSEIPIKRISPSDQKPFIRLVDRILNEKSRNPAADVSDCEREIDRMVYALYDLTPEEIVTVEGMLQRQVLTDASSNRGNKESESFKKDNAYTSPSSSKTHATGAAEKDKKPRDEQNTQSKNEETLLRIDETEQNGVLCVIRQIFNEGLELTRDEAFKKIAKELGYDRVGSRIEEILNSDIRTAVKRGILENDRGTLKILCKTIEGYEREFLKDQFLASIGRPWVDREEAARAFTRFMGFRRAGEKIQDTVRSLINGLLRENRLESDGQMIRRKS